MKSRLLALGIVVALGGCELSPSPNSTVRNIDFTVEGHYTNPSGGPVVKNSSGGPISFLDIRQTGDALEALDNRGAIYPGSLNDPTDQRATFTLQGITSGGGEAVLSGTFTKSGTSSTLQGTWIESTMFENLYATATVGADATNAPAGKEPDCDTNKYQGVCSSHGGIQHDANGCVTFGTDGHVLCNDGTTSPSN
ncbi:MAG: hypothetical protein V1929_00215 [bacterium]